MVVSKIAVMALVTVIAIPILLGYAFNLTETTETSYRSSGDDVNVTPLLQNGTYYNYAHANIYQLNSEFYSGDYYPLNLNQKIIPQFTRYSSQKSSYPITNAVGYNASWNNATQPLNFKYFYEQFDYDPASNHHSGTVYQAVGGVESVVVAINDIQSFYYDQTTGFYQYSKYFNGGISTYSGTNANLNRMVLNSTQGTTTVLVSSYGTNSYADLSQGFKFTGTNPDWYVKMPEKTKSVLYTIDLNSITDANYSVEISKPLNLIFEKKTTDGVVTWTLKERSTSAVPHTVSTLYYDPARNDNTYQVYVGLEEKGISGDRRYYDIHSETRYVGSWPTVIGEANYFLKYDFDMSYNVASNTEFTIDYLYIHKVSEPNTTYSPRLRIDDAYFRAFTYSVINDTTYSPAVFKQNPATTIEDVSKYGISLTFAGNTYTVSKDGKITLEGREIPVKGLVFISTPNGNGTYDNKIGNTLISTSATPSTITFNGAWAASITTDSMEQFTYNKTEWHAGSFGWDGLDHNFLMIGLLTSVGVFIAFGLYVRRTRSSLWPLLVVCGGAVMLFFIML